MCLLFAMWSDNAYACDPRIARFKLEEKERKQAEKRAKQEAFRQKADEEEKVCILSVAHCTDSVEKYTLTVSLLRNLS